MLIETKDLIHQSKRLVFMTGAGVSTPSGIPDYRSMTGIYQGIENPEYLLSQTCLMKEPRKFYEFVKQLYHEDAKPNIIHEKMKDLEKTHEVAIISQNIDGLHDQAGSNKVINFHGNLNDCYCLKCHQTVLETDYLHSHTHQSCGGQIRPNIVLYEEGLSQDNIEVAIHYLSQADLIIIVGTSFKVYPFSGLLEFRHPDSQILVVNKEPITLDQPHRLVQQAAEEFFEIL